MLKLLLVFLFLRVSFAQNYSTAIKKFNENVLKSLTEILVIESDPVEFERSYENFARLLDKNKFEARYNRVPMNYEEFLYFLLMKRKRYVKVEVLSTRNEMAFPPEELNPAITLKLTSLMNYAERYEYTIIIDEVENKTFKISSMFIRKQKLDSEDDFQSTWTPQYLEIPPYSARKFAEDICSDVTFSLNTHMMDEDVRDLFFTDNFLAFIDTNFLYFYDLEMFMTFMKRFNERNEIQNRNNEYMVLTEDNDHIVFMTRVPFKYDDVIEHWLFEIEAVYTYQGWKISKMFVGHPYLTNDVFKNRAGKELLEELKSEVNQTMRESDYIQINGTLLKNAKINVCQELEISYDEGLKIKIRESIGNAHIYSKFNFEKSYDLFIVLYYPDDSGNYTEMKFEANYNSRYNLLEIKKVTVQCPVIKRPPDFEEIEYGWITMDTKRIVVGPRRRDDSVDYFKLITSRCVGQETAEKTKQYDMKEVGSQVEYHD